MSMENMRLTTPAGQAVGEDVLTALTYALFCTSLEPSSHPALNRIRGAVLHKLGTDLNGACIRHVAQEAGDNPLRYAERMAWCRQMVLLTFFDSPAPSQHSRVPTTHHSSATAA
ncbi:hypothetical protein [Streptomyces sp. NPDC060027]|uniref:hypothetical protein n=1 Tax=Streptomyces sp. NPDC060027 TaxID=3347040 RepID=UPI00369B8E09